MASHTAADGVDSKVNDPWSRPNDERGAPPPDEVFEIELDGPGVERASPTVATESPEPNWRKVVALASVAGVALGLVVAAIIVTTAGDDDDDSARPGGDESDEGAAITTPETLPPVAVETTPPELAPVISGRPDLPLELPTYPEAAMPADILDNFVFDADVIGVETADRVEIEMTSEDGLGAMTIEIEYDPTADRYLVTVDQRGPVQRLLIDPADGTVYSRDRVRDGGQWQVVNDPDGTEDLAEFTQSLLLSPIRPNTLVAAATNAETGFILDSGMITRRYRVALPAVAIPEWTSGADEPAAPGASHVFEAYVDETGRLALVQGTVVVNGNRQLIVYRFDHNAEVTIELPDAADTTDLPIDLTEPDTTADVPVDLAEPDTTADVPVDLTEPDTTSPTTSAG